MADEDFDHWDQLADEADQKTNQLVRATAFKAQRIAQQESRVDTGFMKNAWYVRTENESSYGDAASHAKGRVVHNFKLGKNEAANARKFARRNQEETAFANMLFSEVQATPHNEAWIVGGASHTIYNEMGTVHMPAKPMAAPAIERVREPFLKALDHVANGGKG